MLNEDRAPWYDFCHEPVAAGESHQSWRGHPDNPRRALRRLVDAIQAPPGIPTWNLWGYEGGIIAEKTLSLFHRERAPLALL